MKKLIVLLAVLVSSCKGEYKFTCNSEEAKLAAAAFEHCAQYSYRPRAFCGQDTIDTFCSYKKR